MTLTPAEIASLSRLLDEALDLDPPDREAWLAALPAQDQLHAGRLRKMLAERASGKSDERLASLPRLSADADVAHAGDTVGPYRLLREIGHGGMGSVWLAERADGRFQRQVALKLPRLAWGAGLAERMAREREIGMLLEHASIARLYDAGVDERGRPYLAMEYIDGQPLDAWCASRALDIPARLRLILQIARAVAYAHGRLVVHRDLKPSNVLVSADGQAHLLDFGIAKRLSEAAPGAKGLTQEQGRVLTPHYASPEQIAGEAITVASDVYSLGVLLYEMLTGALPIATRRDTPGAVEDAILRGDAPPASSRVKDKATARALRGELDAIMTKAMQREPARRYATVDALAQDIERYLSGETVAARPDSVAYRLRKAVRRHWVGASAAAAVLVAVVAGTGVSLIQAQRASDAAERAHIVKDFVVDVFRVNSRDDPTKNELRQLPAEQLLDYGARLIETKFAGQPGLQAELYGVVGGILLDMSSAKLAEEYARKQIAVQAMVPASPAEQVQAQLLLAQSLAMLGRLKEARTAIAQTLTLRGVDDSLRIRMQLELAKVLLSEADDVGSDQQLRIVEDALDANRTLPAPLRAEVEALRATWLTRRNQFDDAIKKYEQAIESAKSSNGAQSREVANIRLEFSRRLVLHGHGEEAIAQLKLGVDALRNLGGPDDVRAALTEADIAMNLSQFYVIALGEARARIERAQASLATRPNLPKAIRARTEFNLGATLWWGGSIEEGYDRMSTAAADLLPSVEGTELHFEIARNLGRAAEYLGQDNQAERLARDAVKLATRLSGPAGVHAAWSAIDLAHFLRTSGRYSEAEAALKTIPPLRLPHGQADLQALLTEQIIEEEARIALDRGDADGALRILPKENKISVEKYMTDHSLIRGEALCATGNRDEGLRSLMYFIDGWAKAWDKYDPDIARTRAVAGLCALANGQRSHAIEFAALAREAFAKQPRIGTYWQEPSRRLDSLLKLDSVAQSK